ncbi:universal stress protein [Thermocoleostomius sinensis]|uniref:Universal stress protein n=1 Tax=Thermocoleostomius sinensis A174 TaxID=2016057 RepID=A0A9E8ZEW7_9CYAN|nr:universal stress protein [Thermocoleostomius sinensis]WAL60569.1 universal stress protein [Thermocoleostomius sinensis A174]
MVEKILVALDESQSSELVFEEALTLAKQTDAQLLLLHVLSTDERDNSALTCLVPYSTLMTREQLVQHYRAQRQQAEAEGLTMLRAWAEMAKSQGIHARFIQAIGNPRNLICDNARTWQADLIVMGRRNHSRLSEWWTGSISKHVSCHAPCPVHVVQCQERPRSRQLQSDRWQLA